MKKSFRMFKGALAAMVSLSLTAGAAVAQDSPDPIRMVLNDWTGQLISTQLMGEALKRKGLNVEYIQADAMASSSASSRATGRADGGVGPTQKISRTRPSKAAKSRISAKAA